MTELSCKVGTMPELIWLKHRYKIEVGKIILFRRWRTLSWEHNWKQGHIWQVNSDGYFFVELI